MDPLIAIIVTAVGLLGLSRWYRKRIESRQREAAEKN